MKKLLLILLLFSGVAQAQIKFFMPIVTTSTGGGSGTPTTFWKIGQQNEYQTTAPSGYNYAHGTPTQISTAGAISITCVPTVGSTPTITFTNGAGFGSYYTASNTGSNTGVFPDEVIGNGWTFTNGAQFTIGGLTPGTQYWIYFHSNAHSWEASVVSFTIGSTTSSTKNNSDNFGSSSTSPFYTDASLVGFTFTPAATSVTVTCNIVSGSTTAVLSAVVVAK